MREIKFRAWNKIEEKMVYYDKDCSSPDITLNGVLIAHQDQSNVSYIYDLMQFTGLKDKNGTEIYASDIIRWTPKMFDDEIWRTGEVFYKTNGNVGWCVNVTEGHIGIFGLNSNEDYEIIGSKYDKG